MTTWVCVKCAEPVAADRYDLWCPTCTTDTLAVEVAEPKPPRIRPGQYRAICSYFTSRGVVNRERRMRRLTQLTGRYITDYWDLTEAEATTVAATLKDWAHGIR